MTYSGLHQGFAKGPGWIVFENHPAPPVLVLRLNWLRRVQLLRAFCSRTTNKPAPSRHCGQSSQASLVRSSSTKHREISSDQSMNSTYTGVSFMACISASASGFHAMFSLTLKWNRSDLGAVLTAVTFSRKRAANSAQAI